VGVQTEEALVDVLDLLHEVAGELGVLIDGEDSGVGDLVVDPVQKQVNVLGGGDLGRLLVLVVVLPEVFAGIWETKTARCDSKRTDKE